MLKRGEKMEKKKDNFIEYNKLVRNKIPYIIRESNKKAMYYKHPDDKNFDLELMKKVDEELNEFMEEWQDDNRDGMVNELADILEVFKSIVRRNNITFEEVEDRMYDKRNKVGGFDKRIFLIRAEK